MSKTSPATAPTREPHRGPREVGAALRRHPRWDLVGGGVTVLVVVLIAAMITALLDRGPGGGWQALPDPLTVNQNTPAGPDRSRGQTLAIGGGQGNGTITTRTGHPFPAVILTDVICQGDGELIIAGVGGAGCTKGSIVGVEIDRDPTVGKPLSNTLTVTAAPNIKWRITVSASTG